jgi:hypothetical protein
MSQLMNFQTAVLSFAASGDNTAIAAVTGSNIKVWKIIFTTAAAVNVTFKDGASTSLSGALIFGGNGSMVLYYDGSPHFTVTPGNAFIMNLSGAIGIAGVVYYTVGG